MAKKIFIGGRIESAEVGGVVTGAKDILDDTKQKKQNVINKETDDELARLESAKQDNLTFDNAPTENSTNPVTSGGVYTADKALSDAIEAILLLIPSAATALNQLADKAFVNSSVSTATATFRGTSATGLTEEQFLTWANGLTHDMNDYVFWQTVDAAGNTQFKRYKWNGTEWLYEYTLNNSSFTADQWAAINSTITLALVQKLAALPTNAELLQALGLKQDVLTFDNAPTSGSSNPVKSGGVYTAISNEATLRGEEDTRLAGLISDEKTRAENAEGALDGRLTTMEGSVGNIEVVIPSAATANNKLVDNNSLVAYVAAIVTNMDATFNVQSTDGHVTLQVIQVDGAITSVQVTTSDIASAADLTLLAGRVTSVEGNITSLTTRMGTAETDIATLMALYNALQQSAPQVIEPTDTWPVANPSTTVIYRVIDRVNTPPEYYSDYMWNGTAFALMATYNNAIDTTPKKDSANLITSGGVFANIGAFDISEYNKSGSTLATYADLTAALAALPSDFQKGGMSIKFVQSSDNKYVQWRLKSQAFNTNVINWEQDGNSYNDQLSNSAEQITQEQLSFDDGYYYLSSGVIGTTNTSGKKCKLSVNRGIYVIYGRSIGSRICALADVNGTQIKKYVEGQTQYEFTTFEVDSDNMYLWLSCHPDDTITLYSIKSFSSLFENIKNLKDYDTQNTFLCQRTIVPVSSINGKYISSGGDLYDNSGYSYTLPIMVKKGDVIYATATGYLTNVAIISLTNSNGDYYAPVTISIDSNNHCYSYLVKDDGYVVFSYLTSGGLSVIKEHYDYLINNDSDYMIMFRKYAVIGDSLSSGELEFNGITADVYGNSWLSNIASLYGAKRNHYSRGGMYTKQFFELYNNEFQANDAPDCVFIATGTNDGYYAETVYPLGTINDDETANTFVGWYKKVISTVRAKNPYVAIFCVSLYRDYTGIDNLNAYNAMIKDIADLYDYCFFIDIVNRSHINLKSGTPYVSGGHFSTLGYIEISKTIRLLVNEIISKNKTFFSLYALHNNTEPRNNIINE